jgi:hypothetical protein
VSTIPSLASPIRVTAAPGEYCVELKDTGSLPGTASYAIRVLYGVFAQEGDSGPINYASQLLPGGGTTRTFTAQNDGTAIVTLDAITPPAVGTLGIGIGIPRADGGGCFVSTVGVVAAGQTVQAVVDAGTLCVRVFDPGTVTGLTGFSIRIQHP